MLDKLKLVSSVRVVTYGASCLSSHSRLLFIPYLTKSLRICLLRFLHPGTRVSPGFFIVFLERRYPAIIFPSPRHVLQPRKYVSFAIARYETWQLIILCLQVLTTREGGVATVWYVSTLLINPSFGF